MSSSRRIALSLLSGLALLGVYALIERHPGGETRLPAGPTSSAAARGRQELVEPSSRADRAGRAPLEPADSSASPAVEPPEPERTTSAGAPSWILWLHARGPAHDQPVTVRVRARPDGEPFAGAGVVVASCALNERTRIEIGELLDGARPLAALVVAAEHPELRAEVLNLALPAGAGGEGLPPAPVEGTLDLEARSRVVGHVLDPDRTPTPCRVGVWRLDASASAGDRVADADTDAAGHFDVELPGPGGYLLVAAHGDFLPAWRRFDLLPGRFAHDAGEVVLGRGVELEGRFTVGGAAPPRGVSFTLRRELEGAALDWDWRPWGPSPGDTVWTGARVERRSADQVADAEGRFLVRGLAPGEYALQLHGFDEGHGRMSREPRFVAAPARGVTLELGWSRVAVRLELEDPSRPPRAATLVLERPGHAPERMDCFGGELDGTAEREFVFDAGEPLAFQLEIPGLEPLRHDLVAPPAGDRAEVRFDVPALPRGAKLRLELLGERPPSGTAFVVHVASLAGGPPPPDLGLVGGGDTRQVFLRNGALVLTDLAPGPTRVLAYPGKWAGQRSSHWLDGAADVVLRAGDETAADLRIARGGRLRVGQRDGRGGWAGAACEVLDAAGQPVETTFVSYAPDGGGGASARGSLPDLGPSEVVPNLPPGSYTVRVDGAERTVEVRAGETTEVLFD